jgi:ankyrin repeat protein
MQRLRRARCAVGTRDADGSTELYGAAVAGETDKVRLLLVAGAEPNQAGAGFSEGIPLCAACCWGYADTVQALVGSDADANLREADGMTPLGHVQAPLFDAISQGQRDLVHARVSSGRMEST